MKPLDLLGDLRGLFPKPNPVPVPYPIRMMYDAILGDNATSIFLDAQFPVQQAIFYNPTPATLYVNRTPVIPSSNQYDYCVFPFSMFILEKFENRQVAASLSGVISNDDKALVSLLHGYADFVRYAQYITPVTPPMPKPIIGVYIIDTNGDYVLSTGGSFVIEA